MLYIKYPKTKSALQRAQSTLGVVETERRSIELDDCPFWALIGTTRKYKIANPTYGPLPSILAATALPNAIITDTNNEPAISSLHGEAEGWENVAEESS